MTNQVNDRSMWTAGNRIKIIVGHYGSGKTEIALNMAHSIVTSDAPVALIDLDIVNPFFRSAECWEWMKAQGIELIAPPYALTGVDLPVLPPDILSVFARPELRAIFDVGGDDAGAVALGQFRAAFERTGYDLIYVVNPFRPRSSQPEEVIDMIERISRRSRLTPTGLINNANLADDTTSAELEVGMELLEKVSERSGLPILASCGLASVLDRYDTALPKFAIERRLKLEWMEP